MADKKKRRFGNPGRQATLDIADREQARANQAALALAARERKMKGCASTGCGCGDACCS